MNQRLPLLAAVLGAAGLLPFLGAGYVTLSTPEPRATQALAILIAYGAVILAFLGGVHWGFVLHPATGEPAGEGLAPSARAQSMRLVLGVVPSLLGWAALVTTLVLPLEVGLAILLVGFLGTVGFEAQGQRRGLVRPGYMVLRWTLTIVVAAVLTTVLVLRLIGAHIIF
jgi:hypothetical protein